MSEVLSVPACAKRHDIIIAVGRYDDPSIPELYCCERDAVLIRDAFAGLAYINGRPSEQTLLSTADDASACTKTRILRGIEQGTANLTEDDMLVLVLTCHGCTIDQETFIVPSDAKSYDTSSLISAEWIKSLLDNCKAKFKLLLVDACHSGNAALTFKTGGAAALAFDERSPAFQKLVRTSKGVAYATACTHDQVARIRPDNSYSIWMYALVEAVRAVSQITGDGRIVRAEPVLAHAMHQTVWDAHRLCTAIQTPFCLSKIEGLLPLGIPLKTATYPVPDPEGDIERATLIAFERRFERAFGADMPISVDEELRKSMADAGFPLTHVVDVGPKDSKVRLAATFDLMSHPKPDQDNLVTIQELALRLALDRVIVPYLPPVSSETRRLAQHLERIHLVQMTKARKDRDTIFNDFVVMPSFPRGTSVLANEYSDAILRRMGKLFHIVLADIAAPRYDEEYGKSSFGTSEAMAYEDKIVNSAIARLDTRDLAVDLGCGTGRHTFEMSKFFKKIEGLDFSPGMIKVADSKKRDGDLRHQQFRNVAFKVCDVEETPIDYGTDSIDFVTACFGMGSFVENLVPFLTLVKEQLRPGGKAVFSFYNADALLYSVPPPWRDCSLSAVLHPDRNELQVTLPSGDKFRIFCRAYTYAEVKGQLARIFDTVQIYSCPTFASFLPSQYFADGPQGEHARDLISRIDRELAHHVAFPVGAYFTAVCTKAAANEEPQIPADPVVEVTGEENLLTILKENGVDYDVLEHERVRNIRDLQTQLDINPDLMAKAILAIIKSDELLAENHVVFVIPGSQQLDLNKAGALLGRNRREWRFARQKEVKQTYGLEIGGVPPFGYSNKVRVFLDRRLAAAGDVYCGIGNPRKSIKIRSTELVRVANAEVADIVITEGD